MRQLAGRSRPYAWSRSVLPIMAPTNRTPTPFTASVITYTVGMGDTLFNIALKRGIQVTDLLQLNGFTTSTA